MTQAISQTPRISTPMSPSSDRVSAARLPRCGSRRRAIASPSSRRANGGNRRIIPRPTGISARPSGFPGSAAAGSSASTCCASRSSSTASGSAAAAWSTPTPSSSRPRRSGTTPSGPDSRTGGRSCPSTSPPPDGCSAPSTNPKLGEPDLALKRAAERRGLGHTFKPTDVSIYFGQPDVTVPDPYFDGAGPDRTGLQLLRRLHGRLPVRRQEHPRQELSLSRRGAAAREVVPDTQVELVEELPGGGYRLRWKRPKWPFATPRIHDRAQGRLFGRGPRHGQAPDAVQGKGRPAADLRSARQRRQNQLGGPAGDDLAEPGTTSGRASPSPPRSRSMMSPTWRRSASPRAPMSCSCSAPCSPTAVPVFPGRCAGSGTPSATRSISGA